MIFFSYTIFSWCLLDHSDVVAHGLGIFLDGLPLTVGMLFCSCPVDERASTVFEFRLFPLLTLMWDPLPPRWESPPEVCAASDFPGLLPILTVLITWRDAFLISCLCLPLWFYLDPLSVPVLCCPHLSHVPFILRHLATVLVFGEPCLVIDSDSDWPCTPGDSLLL